MIGLFILALLTGAVLPVQSAMNTRLKGSLGTNIGASWISFMLGAVFMAALVALRGDSFIPPTNVPWWTLTGGIYGVAALITIIYIFPKVGAVETIALPVVGKIISGLLIDNFGWLNAPQQPITGWRILGDVLALTGVFLALSGNSRAKGAHLLPRFLGVLVGIYGAIQAAVNGNLGAFFGSGASAGFISMTGASIVLLVLCLVTRQWPHKPSPGPWWMWLGGPGGALFVAGTAAIQPILGTGMTLLVVLLGQIIASMSIDHFALFGAVRTPVTLLRVCGTVLLACGMCLYYMF